MSIWKSKWSVSNTHGILRMILEEKTVEQLTVERNLYVLSHFHTC